MIKGIAESILGLAERLLGAAPFGNFRLQVAVGGFQLLRSLAYPGFEARFIVPQGLQGPRKFGRAFPNLTRHRVEGPGQVGDLHDSGFARPMSEVSHGQLAGRILQTDDRAYDPAGHAESREEDQASGKTGDVQRRVSRLCQGAKASSVSILTTMPQ